MSTVDARGLVGGQILAVDAGPVVVAVHRADVGFRLSVRYRSTGVAVPQLCRWFAAEGPARRAARMAVGLFGSGLSVRRVLDALAVFAAAQPECPGPVEAAAAMPTVDRLFVPDAPCCQALREPRPRRVRTSTPQQRCPAWVCSLRVWQSSSPQRRVRPGGLR